MAGRRCTTCGAAVSDLALACPRCGADPDVAVIEIGSATHDRLAWRPPRGGGSRRWVPVVLVLAAAWLVLTLLGILDGRDAGDRERAAPTTSTTATSATEAPRATKRIDDPIGSGALVLGETTGLHLLVAAFGAVIDIDLDTGARAIPHDIGGDLVDGDDRGLLVRFGHTYHWRPAPLEEGVERLVAETAGNAWLLEESNAVWVDAFGGTFSLVDLDRGLPTSTVTLPSPAYPVGTAGDRLVVAAAGSLYTVDTTGAISDLGAGSVIALGYGHALVERCDPQLRCRRVVLDLRGGDVREVGVVDPPLFLASGPWIGPGGSVLYVPMNENGTGLVLITGGTTIELLAPTHDLDTVQTVAFSADGRWVAAGGEGMTWVGAADGHTSIIFDPQGLGPTEAVVLVAASGG